MFYSACMSWDLWPHRWRVQFVNLVLFPSEMCSAVTQTGMKQGNALIVSVLHMLHKCLSFWHVSSFWKSFQMFFYLEPFHSLSSFFNMICQQQQNTHTTFDWQLSCWWSHPTMQQRHLFLGPCTDPTTLCWPAERRAHAQDDISPTHAEKIE